MTSGQVDPHRLPAGAGVRRAVVALLTGGVVGKISGAAREFALAAAYGTSSTAAAFRIGQTATLIPLNLLTSDALTAGFVPLFGERFRRSPAEAEFFYRAVRLLLFVTTCVTAVATFAGAPWIVAAMASALPATTEDDAVTLVRIMVVGAPFYVDGALSGCVALSRGRYQLVSLRSTITNVGLLLGVGAAVVSGEWALLAVGFTAGSICFSVWATVSMRRSGLLRTALRLRDLRSVPSCVRPFVRVAAALVWVPLLVQAGEVAERVATSRLGEIYVPAADFANFVVDTVVTVLAVPLGLAGLAHVSMDGGGEETVRERVEVFMPVILAIGLPMSVVLSCHAVTVVDLLYARGRFGESSTLATAVLLQGFALGLWAQMLGYVLLKIYSARLHLLRQVLVAAAAVAAGATVLGLAVLSGQAWLVGVAGSVTGVVSTVLVARQTVGTGRLVVWLLRFAPGVAVLVGICRWGGGRPLPVVVGVVVLSVVLWAVYCLAVPTIRAAMMVLPLVPRVVRRLGLS